ncbi:hypothetical protein L9F63_018211, partial [Diploptera punctata]
ISPGTWIHLLEEASSVVRGVAVLHRHNTRDPRYLILSGIGLLRLYPPALGSINSTKRVEASRVVRGVAILPRHNTRGSRYLILSGFGFAGYTLRHLDPFPRRSESRGPRCCYYTPPQHILPPALRYLRPFTRRSESRDLRCCYFIPLQHLGIPIFMSPRESVSSVDHRVAILTRHKTRGSRYLIPRESASHKFRSLAILPRHNTRDPDIYSPREL